ncbi:MAG: DUF3592 domain-containing protein [Candidatus Lokiarchaeota archaeon]|nr:DUF3592 domain-containing protein [Candidatus Lokiarchaeota archaeon]
MAYTWIVSIVLFIVAGIFFYFAWQKYQFKQKTEQWTPTTAKVIEAHFEKGADEYESWWDVHLELDFTVNGKQYRSFTKKRDDRIRKRAIKKKYSPGTLLNIYYNPKNPTETVFSKGVDYSDLILFIFPIIFFLIGVSLL